MFEWKSVWTDRPSAGDRIVVLYTDGSGASLFAVGDDLSLTDSDGEDCRWETLDDAGYSVWAVAPAGTKLWFELRDDAA